MSYPKTNFSKAINQFDVRPFENKLTWCSLIIFSWWSTSWSKWSFRAFSCWAFWEKKAKESHQKCYNNATPGHIEPWSGLTQVRYQHKQQRDSCNVHNLLDRAKTVKPNVKVATTKWLFHFTSTRYLIISLKFCVKIVQDMSWSCLPLFLGYYWVWYYFDMPAVFIKQEGRVTQSTKPSMVDSIFCIRNYLLSVPIQSKLKLH